ncbi:hypothetical protein, partial [Klebsiella pneumoniae]|uniref:hypothetical protein n=1 Tax=Klebsiella pneumoniae TaxID=573 RepID=UPI003D079B73
RKRAYCLKIQPATGSFARNLIYSTKPIQYRRIDKLEYALDILERTDSPKSQTYGSFIRFKAIWLTLTSRFDDAVRICKNELTELTYAEVEQFIEKLKLYQVKV